MDMEWFPVWKKKNSLEYGFLGKKWGEKYMYLFISG